MFHRCVSLKTPWLRAKSGLRGVKRERGSGHPGQALLGEER